MIKVITNPYTEIIIGIGTVVEVVETGVRCNDYIIAVSKTGGSFSEPLPKIYEFDTIPDYIKEGKYCYNTDNGFYENPKYHEPIDPFKKIVELEAENEQIKRALDDLILNGGVL